MNQVNDEEVGDYEDDVKRIENKEKRKRESEDFY